MASEVFWVISLAVSILKPPEGNLAKVRTYPMGHFSVGCHQRLRRTGPRIDSNPASPDGYGYPRSNQHSESATHGYADAQPNSNDNADY